MSTPMELLFEKISEVYFEHLQVDEELNLNFEAEESLFIRFNKSMVRQIVDVTQVNITLFLQLGKKNALLTVQIPVTLFSEDGGSETLLKNLAELRDEVIQLPDDPFALPMQNNGQSWLDKSELALPSAEHYCTEILSPAAKVDMAGLLVSGTNYVGNRNSCGQAHWFVTRSFYFDYSIYSAKEKAVKGVYADVSFNRERYLEKIHASLEYLRQMDRPNKILSPGRYRCYFAPEAIGAIVDHLWNGLSRGALARGDSPMGDLEGNRKSLSPLISIAEDFSLGLVPAFNAQGELAPQHLQLVRDGKLENLLTSSRTAEEYQLESNQANEAEAPRSLTIAPGTLAESDILETLGTGLYISNLHYLNWSDIGKGRITGMTRFACFWVENGEISSPIQDLRFDETFYNFWGAGLEALSSTAEIVPIVSTYESRSLGGIKVPGMLINNFNFCM